MAKTDANEILQNGGNDAVNNAMDKIAEKFDDKFKKVEEEIAKKQAAKKKEQQKKRQDEQAAKEKKITESLIYLPLDDAGNADRIFSCAGDKIRFVEETQTFLTYKESGVWNFSSEKCNSVLYPYCREISDLIKQNAPKYKMVINSEGNVTTDETKKQPKNTEEVEIGEKISNKWRSVKTWRNAVESLKGKREIIITQADLDKNPMLLNVKNGYIDLETGKFYPPDPKQLFTKQANVIYNPSADCPVFNKFISEVIPDEQTRAAVLRYLGYCLTGKVNAEKSLFVIGEGGNGKGTLFDTINYLIGDYSSTFNVELILRQKYSTNANAPTAEIAKLLGLRLAIAPEIPAGREFDLAIFKSLTGGDVINARPPYQLPINFPPTHKFILSGQYFPKVENAHDIGFLRRFLPVIFNQDFSGNKSDVHLKEKLRVADELSGILNLLIRECLEWQNSGLIMSDAMQQTKENYIEDNDFIANFIADNCTMDFSEQIKRKEFLDRLKKEYPKTLRFNDNYLEKLISKIDGITFISREDNTTGRYKRTAVFQGIRWNDEQN